VLAHADERSWHDTAMTDARLVDGRAERVVALLESNVRTELQVTNGGFELGLSDETIELLMQGVTSGLLYAFAVDPSPAVVSASRIRRRRQMRKPLSPGPAITRSPTDTTALTCR
jgi:hypothetical protein